MWQFTKCSSPPPKKKKIRNSSARLHYGIHKREAGTSSMSFYINLLRNKSVIRDSNWIFTSQLGYTSFTVTDRVCDSLSIQVYSTVSSYLRCKTPTVWEQVFWSENNSCTTCDESRVERLCSFNFWRFSLRQENRVFFLLTWHLWWWKYDCDIKKIMMEIWNNNKIYFLLDWRV